MPRESTHRHRSRAVPPAERIVTVGPDDFAGVDALLRAAFDGPDEAELVARLRADGDMLHEARIAAGGHRVAGYLALSAMRAPAGWACLAPVAVRPDCQDGRLAPEGADRAPWRIGSAMMRALVQMAGRRPGIPATIVVLGRPEFYERFGFSRARAARLTTPYPQAFTMLLGPGDSQPAERLVYPAAFGAG